ncbi:MAG: M48 family metalloprotease, partial [Hoeflea sp.]|nr:M48 family metalloprotease [Hoeflea sp.]
MTVPATRRSRIAMALLCGALVLSGCQTLGEDVYESSVKPSDTPQTAEKAGASDPRTRIGANEHPRILATYGGEFSDAKTERLVARIVGALTLVSENPQQAYRITVLNSPAVNAFALPGGFLYVTRGLLALANDASEVAAVLSHEMAHVTANHGLERQRREREVELAGQVAEELFSNSLTGRQVIARGKLSLAAFSRNQELQADVIGVRMLGEAGYDPYSAARFLDSMNAN